MTKNLLFITGTRADFGKMEPLAVAARNAGYRVQFFVTGMHMLDRYGATKKEVERLDGIDIHEFINQRIGDPQDLVLSKTVLGFSDWVYEHKPDLVVVHGDRVEALAASLVCAINYIRCAHIEGGEVSGTIDEVFRHCNTKLGTYHFVSSDQAKERVVALGENPNTVFNIGSPELDFHNGESGVTLEMVLEHYEIPFRDYGIVIFHPVTSELNSIGRQVENIFQILSDSGKNFVVISPNNDPGSDIIFDIIDNQEKIRFRHLPSMRFSYFSELLKNASAIIGNSSAGVREAPFIGIPTLNIGTRQHMRSKAGSITDVSAYENERMVEFLRLNWGVRRPRDASFGQGNAAESFLAELGRVEFWTVPLQKHFYE